MPARSSRRPSRRLIWVSALLFVVGVTRFVFGGYGLASVPTFLLILLSVHDEFSRRPISPPEDDSFRKRGRFE